MPLASIPNVQALIHCTMAPTQPKAIAPVPNGCNFQTAWASTHLLLPELVCTAFLSAYASFLLEECRFLSYKTPFAAKKPEFFTL
jgi:hypothetical protein